MAKPQVIFFGNGPLAEAALSVISKSCEILFYAHSASDLTEVAKIKKQHPEAHGILASFGVIIKNDLLQIFEPEGILNIHPSLLPQYRGPAPIETAILDGASDFSVSIMKLAKDMDAGDIYHQITLSDLPLDKATIYQKLATAGAEWLVQNLENLPTPVPQDHSKATFTEKLDKSLSYLTPDTDTADQTLRKIVAYQGYPKPKYKFFGTECVILEAHQPTSDEKVLLPLECKDRILSIDRLQPAGRRPMDARGFINGYAKNR